MSNNNSFLSNSTNTSTSPTNTTLSPSPPSTTTTTTTSQSSTLDNNSHIISSLPPNPQISGSAVNKITNLTDEEIYHDLHATQRLCLTPLEIYVKSRHSGETKPHMDSYKTLFLSILGGAYVSLGAATTFYVGGNMKEASWNPNVSERNYGVYRLVVGAFGYQMGFTAITLLGADLFTSHCCYTGIAWLENRISTFELFKVLALVWIGNFFGCLIVAGILDGGQVFDDHDAQLILTTEQKLLLPFRVIILRALVANFLVAIATLTQISALDVMGKIFAIFLPIFTFAAIGFEHSIANMFILPMGCMQQADCTIHKVLYRNILPATIGNWLGGLFMAVPMAICFGHPERRFIAIYNGIMDLLSPNKENKSNAKEYEITLHHHKDHLDDIHGHSTDQQSYNNNSHHNHNNNNNNAIKRTPFRFLSH